MFEGTIDKHISESDVLELISERSLTVQRVVLEAIAESVEFLETKADGEIVFHQWAGRELLPFYLPYGFDMDVSFASNAADSIQCAALLAERLEADGTITDGKSLLKLLDSIAHADQNEIVTE